MSTKRWNKSITAALIFCAMMVHAEREEEFFTYNDCAMECKNSKLSCLISEPTKFEFLNICTYSELGCALSANSQEVCLRPNKPPLGGNTIWPDF